MSLYKDEGSGDVVREVPLLRRKGRDETALESRSFAFRFWEKLKSLGRLLIKSAKLAVILLAAGYLAYSVYELVQPDPEAQVYERIGDLEIRKDAEAGIP